MKFNREISNAFLKEIQSIEQSVSIYRSHLRSKDQHKVIDLWIYIILYSIGNFKKSVETSLRKKITSGQFSETLLRNSIENHAPALKEHFSTLLSLSETFLRSTESSVRFFGSGMYCLGINLCNHSSPKLSKPSLTPITAKKSLGAS